MNSEKIPNHTEIEPTETLLKRVGHKIISFFKTKKTGETAPNNSYLLSEHLTEEENRKWKTEVDIWDNIDISIDNELGEIIEKNVRDPKYRFGVHRSTEIDGSQPKTDAILQKIMQNGLVVLGDSRSGSVRNNAPPSKSVDFADNLLNAVIFTKTGRWGSNGAVLVAIPSEYLDEDGYIIPGKENKVYNYNKFGNPLIKPEFILGFAPGGGRHGAHITFIPKSEILDSTTENTDPQ